MTQHKKTKPKVDDDTIPDVLTKDWLEKAHFLDEVNGLGVIFGGHPDHQQLTSYYWQNVVLTQYKWDHTNLDQASGQKVIDRVRDLFGMPHDVPLTMEVGKDGATTAYNKVTNTQAISCGTTCSNEAVLIHEATHSVLNTAGYRVKIEGHGATFVRVYSEVLYLMKGIDKKPLLDMAVKMGLKVDADLPKELADRMQKAKAA